MSYSVVFTAQIRPEFKKEAVVQSLASMFRKDLLFIEKMLAGKPVVIKRDLEQEEARKYQFAINKAGVFASLIDQEEVHPASQKANTSNTDEEATASEKETRKAGKQTKPMAGTNEISVAGPGVKIIEHVMPEEPAIDISQLTMSAAGEIIVEPSVVEPVAVHELVAELSDTGTRLSDEVHANELEIDISTMSMAESGSELQDK